MLRVHFLHKRGHWSAWTVGAGTSDPTLTNLRTPAATAGVFLFFMGGQFLSQLAAKSRMRRRSPVGHSGGALARHLDQFHVGRRFRISATVASESKSEMLAGISITGAGASRRTGGHMVAAVRRVDVLEPGEICGRMPDPGRGLDKTAARIEAPVVVDSRDGCEGALSTMAASAMGPASGASDIALDAQQPGMSSTGRCRSDRAGDRAGFAA